MLFRNALMTAGVAALAIPVLAGGPPLQMSGTANRAEPIRARAYTVVDGHMVYTSDWVPMGGGVSSRSNFTAAWDAIELDLSGGVLGAPTDDSPGCQWRVPAGNRWYGGPGYNNPFVSNDMTTSAAAAGQQCTGVGFMWFWDVGPLEADTDSNGAPDVHCIILLQTCETMDVSNAGAPLPHDPAHHDDGSDSIIDGILYDFGQLNGGGWYYHADLSASGLFHTMPADGVGGYQLIFAIDRDPDTGTLIIPTGIDGSTGLGVAAQPFVWGCGADEADADGNPQPDGRIGTQESGQYDDDAPTNGVHDYDADANFDQECYDYTAAGSCPAVQSSAVGFYYKANTNPCACVGDVDGDGDRDLQDLANLLSQFGQTGDPGSLGCADTNGDGAIGLQDLANLLAGFGQPC